MTIRRLKTKHTKPEVEPETNDAEDVTPKLLTPHGKVFERGPEGMRAESFADGSPDPEPQEQFDTSILDHIIGRLWKASPFSEPILALEILDGPYKGVVYSYSSFTFLPAQMADGTVPTKYETEVHVIPVNIKDTFTKDEAFDQFTTEVLLSWIGYIHTNDMSPLIKMRARTI